MSLHINRRALTLTALTGTLLIGAALATSTAAHADDSTKNSTPSSSTDAPEITITDAADTAESQYPDCDVTAALLYDIDETQVWDVELTCDSGTVKYVSIDADTGKLSTKSTDTSATDDDDSTSTDPNDAPGTGANDDYT